MEDFSRLKTCFSEYTPADIRDCKYISQPQLINCFSVDENRTFVDDYSNIKFIKLPEKDSTITFDLNRGLEIYRPKLESAYKERIDHLLKFVIANLSSLKSDLPDENVSARKRQLLRPHIVCFRGLLSKIMSTPYEAKDGWTILATRYRGTLYLCALDTPENEAQRKDVRPEQQIFGRYGFQFEKFVLTSDPAKDCDTDSPVIEAEEFCGVFESKLHGQIMLYGAELDGFRSNKLIDIHNLSKADVMNEIRKLPIVEVKVKMKELSKYHWYNFQKFYTRKWWCQSFLVGINNIYVGRRDKAGIVREIDEFRTCDLPRIGKAEWRPEICMMFCSDFLKSIEKVMREVDCPKTVYVFNYDRNVSTRITCSTNIGGNPYSFLPDWYTDHVK